MFAEAKIDIKADIKIKPEPEDEIPRAYTNWAERYAYVMAIQEKIKPEKKESKVEVHCKSRKRGRNGSNKNNNANNNTNSNDNAKITPTALTILPTQIMEIIRRKMLMRIMPIIQTK